MTAATTALWIIQFMAFAIALGALLTLLRRYSLTKAPAWLWASLAMAGLAVEGFFVIWANAELLSRSMGPNGAGSLYRWGWALGFSGFAVCLLLFLRHYFAKPRKMEVPAAGGVGLLLALSYLMTKVRLERAPAMLTLTLRGWVPLLLRFLVWAGVCGAAAVLFSRAQFGNTEARRAGRRLVMLSAIAPLAILWTVLSVLIHPILQILTYLQLLLWVYSYPTNLWKIPGRYQAEPSRKRSKARR